MSQADLAPVPLCKRCSVQIDTLIMLLNERTFLLHQGREMICFLHTFTFEYRLHFTGSSLQLHNWNDICYDPTILSLPPVDRTSSVVHFLRDAMKILYAQVSRGRRKTIWRKKCDPIHMIFMHFNRKYD